MSSRATDLYTGSRASFHVAAVNYVDILVKKLSLTNSLAYEFNNHTIVICQLDFCVNKSSAW